MTESEAPRLQPRGSRDKHAGAGLSCPEYTTTRTACQPPAWIVTKAGADRAWPGVVSLVRALGYGTPSVADWKQDWRHSTDFTTPDGSRWAWRTRDARYIGFRDITIRKARPSGAPTEADKLHEADRMLWTWTNTAGAVVDWLVLDAGKVAPMLSRSWPVLTMPDAQAVCVPWAALSLAGCIVAASANVKAAL
jgi:hypothetical protein